MERPFHFIENNFLAGRTFADWDELNAEARQWCDDKNAMFRKHLHAVPNELFVVERPTLEPLPEWMPDVYRLHQRIVDSEGYVSVQGHRYSVPYELVSRQVEVRETKDRVLGYRGPRELASHKKLLDSTPRRVTELSHRPPKGETSSATKALSTLSSPGRFRLYYALEQRADGGTERRTRWIPFADIEELYVEGVDRIPDVTELPYRIRIGDYAHVHVLDDVLKGDIEALDGESIRIENRTFRMDEVTKIDLREHDSLANGALIGFGAGAGLVGLACTQGGCTTGIAVAAVVFYGGVGAGIGALIDSAATRYTTVYLGNQRNKTLNVSPLVTPDAKGLLISVRF